MGKIQHWQGSDTKSLEIDDVKYEVEFNYKGWYNPGCTYGPPENCYPPEGETEYTITQITPLAGFPVQAEAVRWLINNYAPEDNE